MFGVDGDRPALSEHHGVEGGIDRRGDLDDHVDARGRPLPDRRRDVLGPVVDDVLGSRRARQEGLLGTAHGGGDATPRPSRELDCGVAHRTRASGDQDTAAGQRPRHQRGRTGFGDRQTAMGGQPGHSERRAQLEGGCRRQRHDVAGRHHHLLLRGTVGPPVLRLPDPDALSDPEPGDALADAVDHARAILVWHDLVKGTSHREAAARFPVCRVDTGDVHRHPNLSWARRRHRAVDQTQHRRVAMLRVRNRPHPGVPLTTGPATPTWEGRWRQVAPAVLVTLAGRRARPSSAAARRSDRGAPVRTGPTAVSRPSPAPDRRAELTAPTTRCHAP